MHPRKWQLRLWKFIFQNKVPDEFRLIKFELKMQRCGKNLLTPTEKFFFPQKRAFWYFLDPYLGRAVYSPTGTLPTSRTESNVLEHNFKSLFFCSNFYYHWIMDIITGNSNNNNASSKTEKLKENVQSVQVICAYFQSRFKIVWSFLIRTWRNCQSIFCIILD